MDPDTQWAVESIEGGSGVQPTIIDDDADSATPSASKTSASDLKKRKRIDKLRVEFKRRKQETRNRIRNAMDGVELLDTDRQAAVFQSVMTKTSALEAVQDVDFVKVESEQRRFRDLPAAMKKFQASWREKLVRGAPTGGVVVLVLTYSATRAVDIVKALRAFQTPKLPIAKLFAKHIKIDMQIEALEGDVRVAVGTPNRVLKLFDAGALSSSKLEHVVIDMGRDAKSLSFFDIESVRSDFCILFSKYLASSLRSQTGQLRLCLY